MGKGIGVVCDCAGEATGECALHVPIRSALMS